MSEDEVKSSFLPEQCESHGITFDAGQLTGVWRGHRAAFSYEWQIDEKRDTTRIEQTVRTGSWLLHKERRTHAVILVTLVLFYLIQRAGSAFPTNLSLEAGLPILGLVVLELFLLADPNLYFTRDEFPDPLVDGLETGEAYRRLSPLIIFRIVALVGLAAMLVTWTVNIPLLTAGVAVGFRICAGTLNIIRAWDAEPRVLRAVEGSPIAGVQLSGVARQHLWLGGQLCGITLIVPLAWAFGTGTVGQYGMGAEVVTYLESNGPFTLWPIDAPLALLLLVGGISAIRSISDETLVLEVNRFQTTEATRISQLVDILATLCATILIYAGLARIIEGAFGVQLLPFAPAFRFPATMAVVGFFSLYFVAGVVVQWYSRTQRAMYMVSNSVPAEVSTPAYSGEFRRLESDAEIAQTFQTFHDEYIIISEGKIDKLPTDEALATVVAHEEGHIENGDVRLCYLIQIISSCTFVGQNVYYALLDFQAREQAADDYAAVQVGEETVVETLLQLELSASDSIQLGFGMNFIPDADEAVTDAAVPRPFSLFFGTFGLSAHPELAERMHRLSDTDETQDSSSDESVKGWLSN